MASSKVAGLAEALERHVTPGMHLHFASTPSRSNAAIRALGKRYRGTSPAFTVSSTGFHSTAHLLGRFRLATRYAASFYGDNFPHPRPNPLYARLAAEGVRLEHWSALSYVAAFRAGALGHPYGVTTSLLGSSMEAELSATGRFTSVPDPHDPGRRIGLAAAIHPDVAFIHVPAADAQGRAIASLPHSEGVWGALAAKRGVIVTTERIVDERITARCPESIVLPPHRVLAVCRAPFGAHPQPLFAPPHLDVPSYADDFDAYELFRRIAADDAAEQPLVDDVLLGSDEAYAAHFDLPRRIARPSPPAASPEQVRLAGEARPSERLMVLAARRIAKVVRENGYRVILAGVGHAFFATRLAKQWLDRDGIDVDVLVETGMFGIDCGPESGPFLLGYDVIARTKRLTSIEDVLGAITCGAENRCLGVIGAAEVDARGDVNSTRLSDGTPLVGSGGANDIASSAAEVVVLASAERGRLVDAVSYVTSPGRAVRNVVTSEGILSRDDASSPWRIEETFQTGPECRLRDVCPWPIAGDVSSKAAPPSLEERTLLASLDPTRRVLRHNGT
jgi:acyl CoA:acetate/3-ketoacid CoA transferase alpha subunit